MIFLHIHFVMPLTRHFIPPRKFRAIALKVLLFWASIFILGVYATPGYFIQICFIEWLISIKASKSTSFKLSYEEAFNNFSNVIFIIPYSMTAHYFLISPNCNSSTIAWHYFTTRLFSIRTYIRQFYQTLDYCWCIVKIPTYKRSSRQSRRWRALSKHLPLPHGPQSKISAFRHIHRLLLYYWFSSYFDIIFSYGRSP